MNLLDKFYTRDHFSELLVNNLNQNNPINIIDLGVGKGSLIRAAYNRWQMASFYGADIDEQNLIQLSAKFPFLKTKVLNVLSEEILEDLGIKNESIDIAICNPPYYKVKDKAIYNSLFDMVGLSDCKKLKIVKSDIVFLAQNLKILRQGGELGIILPDSLITGLEYKYFRKELVSNHNVRAIIQLPDNVFSKTEARTYILIIEKSEETNNFVPIYLAQRDGHFIDKILVKKCDLEKRMDFSYYKWKNKYNTKNIKSSLLGYQALINRGTITQKEAISLQIPYFHTTHFPQTFTGIKLDSYISKSNKFLLAEQGDILLARVGKRCIGKVTLIEEGRIIITDCVYRIRVPTEHRIQLWQFLISDEGQLWLKSIAHGVCAQVISKSDLLILPIAL